MTSPQEEAERRWPDRPRARDSHVTLRYGFVAGAEWMQQMSDSKPYHLSEEEFALYRAAQSLGLTAEQVQRLGPLVEAAFGLLDAHGPTNYEQAVANVIYAASRLGAAALEAGE